MADPDRIQELREQQALLGALREGGADDQALAAQLDRQYQAERSAELCADVYRAANGEPGAPAGWIRASEHPELLQEYGIDWSPEKLQELTRPNDSSFRAEIYLPDRTLLGPDAKPMLVFKGTGGPVLTSRDGEPVHRDSVIEDWVNNGRQGMGLESDHYERAMRVAFELARERIGGDFAVAGHSLGGGLASAASAITGVPAFTFNSAGLHPNTPARFAANLGLTVHDTSELVTAYQVQGEVLTDVQTGIARMDEQRRQQLNLVLSRLGGLMTLPGVQEQVESAIKAGLPASEQSRRDAAEFLAHIATPDGQQALRNVPTAAGRIQPVLAARTWDEQGRLIERPQAAALSEVAEYAGPLLDLATAAVEGARAGRLLGEPVRMVGAGVGNVLDSSGDGARHVLAWEGRVAEQGLRLTGQIGDWQVRATGEAVAQVRLVQGEVSARLDEAQCEGVRWFNDTTRGLLRSLPSGWVPDAWGEAAQRRTDAWCEAQRSEAARTRASADADAGAIRSTAAALGADIEHVASRSGAQWRSAAELTGEHIDATLDFGADAVRSTTRYAPTAGAGAGAALGGLVGVTAQYGTAPGRLVNGVPTAVVFGQAKDSAAEALARHGMTDTVLPSMELRTLEMEGQARRLLDRRQEAPAQPTRTGALLLDEPAHPRHPLFRQSLDRVHGLDASVGRTPDIRSTQLAGAVTAAAAEAGMERVDRLVLGRDARTVFAVEGDVADPAHRRAGVEVAAGMQTPLAVSSARVDQADLERAAIEQAQTQVRTQESALRVA